MTNFLRLVQNENMKLYRKRSTLIILLFFLLFLILGGVVVKTSYMNQTGDWRTLLNQENGALKEELNQPDAPVSQIKNQLAENNYRLAHNLSPYDTNNGAQLTQDLSNFFILAVVFTIMTSGAVVSSEFNKGTVKLWMIRPVRRSVLLFSKYISQLLFFLLLVLGLFIVSWLLGLIFYGSTGWGIPFLSVKQAVVHSQSALSHLLAVYGLHFIEGLVVITLAFMLSTITLNAAFATGLTLFLELTKLIFNQMQTSAHWLKYFLFSNLDLASAIWPTDISPPLNFSFSLTIILIYYVLFLVVTWTVFIRRDVS